MVERLYTMETSENKILTIIMKSQKVYVSKCQITCYVTILP